MTNLEVGTVFTLWRPAGIITVAGKGAVTQRFSPGSWDSRVGGVTLLYRKGQVMGTGELLCAVVADDGAGVNLTYEIVAVAA